MVLDGLTMENAHLRVTLLARRLGRVACCTRRAVARRSRRRATASSCTTTARSRSTPGTSTRPRSRPVATSRPPTSWHASSTPLRAEVTFERPWLTQVVRLDAGSRRLEFHTTIDWHEEHTLLKVCFPLAVHARNATYEMPFGYAERPTHWSSSWDRARYEVPGHRWADLSEHGFGVALLNDCKYGWSCFGNELRLSLLRAPRSPDPEADIGRHEFAYALVPHAGGWREAGIVGEAASLQRAAAARSPRPRRSRSRRSTTPNLVLDTIKRAEDSDALVLRLYEAHGARGTARLRVAAPFYVRPPGERPRGRRRAARARRRRRLIPYRPHQIVTVKLS